MALSSQCNLEGLVLLYLPAEKLLHQAILSGFFMPDRKIEQGIPPVTSWMRISPALHLKKRAVREHDPFHLHSD